MQLFHLSALHRGGCLVTVINLAFHQFSSDSPYPGDCQLMKTIPDNDPKFGLKPDPTYTPPYIGHYYLPTVNGQMISSLPFLVFAF
jgi:hypothetical protein